MFVALCVILLVAVLLEVLYTGGRVCCGDLNPRWRVWWQSLAIYSSSAVVAEPGEEKEKDSRLDLD